MSYWISVYSVFLIGVGVGMAIGELMDWYCSKRSKNLRSIRSPSLTAKLDDLQNERRKA